MFNNYSEILYDISLLTREDRTPQLDKDLIRSSITTKTTYFTRESDQTHTQPFNLFHSLDSTDPLDQELNPVSIICSEISYDISSSTREDCTPQLEKDLIRSPIITKSSHFTIESDQTYTQPYNIFHTRGVADHLLKLTQCVYLPIILFNESN